MCIVCRVSYVCLLTLTLHISPKLTTWNFNIEFSMVFVCQCCVDVEIEISDGARDRTRAADV